tara:strand:- start:59 stop:181 length:123 start_codon:yes stop_codon:yes gene_type:complete
VKYCPVKKIMVGRRLELIIAGGVREYERPPNLLQNITVEE